MFHKGELEVQQKMNVQNIAVKVGNSINHQIIGGAIPFIESQSTFVVNSEDDQGNHWTSLLVGTLGFIHVPTNSTFEINIDALASDKHDVFFENIKHQKNIGCIFIELASTKRYRVNGIVTKITSSKIFIRVTEAYPNCPKYIQQRGINNVLSTQKPLQTVDKKLPTHLIELIKNSDTFFIGSGVDDKKDASHRGGKTGFIEVLNPKTLKIPEYVGNSLYNTLGNIAINPNTGLLFIDFSNNSVLQLNGKATILYHQNSEKDKLHTDTGLFWTFEIEQYIYTQNHHVIDWDFKAFSRFNY